MLLVGSERSCFLTKPITDPEVPAAVLKGSLSGAKLGRKRDAQSRANVFHFFHPSFAHSIGYLNIRCSQGFSTNSFLTFYCKKTVPIEGQCLLLPISLIIKLFNIKKI